MGAGDTNAVASTSYVNQGRDRRRRTILRARERASYIVEVLTIPTASALSDGDLVATAARLAAEGRQVTADLVALLAVLVERKLYAVEGYGTAHDFCVRRLLLSDAQAYHRLAAAQVAWRFPSVLPALREGRLTLTSVALLRPHLTDANAAAALAWAEGRSRREVERFVRGIAPLPDVAPSLRRVPASAHAGGTVTESAPPVPPPTGESRQFLQRGGGGAVPGSWQPSRAVPLETSVSPAMRTASLLPEADDTSAPIGDPQRACESAAAAALGTSVNRRAAPRPAEIRPLTPTRYSVRLTITEETHAKLRRAADLLGHAVPSGDLAEVLDRALTLLVEQLERRKYAARRVPPPVTDGHRTPDADATGKKEMQGTNATAATGDGGEPAVRHVRPHRQGQRRRAAKWEQPTGRRSPGGDGAENAADSAAPGSPAAPATPAASRARRSRYIPAAVRREVYRRDQGRCTYVGPAGRCGRTRRLEFHHRVPFADGGPSTAANICLTCRIHNSAEATRWFGEDFDRSKREGPIEPPPGRGS